GPVEAVASGLHEGPGEFAEADDFEAGLDHPGHVGRPPLDGVLFWIPGDAEFHWPGGQEEGMKGAVGEAEGSVRVCSRAQAARSARRSLEARSPPKRATWAAD